MTLWGGFAMGAPTGFVWGRWGGTDNALNQWEMLASYAFSPYFHDPNPPITLITITATGGVTRGDRVVSSAAQEQAASGATIEGNRIVAGSAGSTPLSYGGQTFTGSYNSGQLFPASTFTFTYSHPVPAGCTLLACFDTEDVGVATAVSSVIDDAGNVYTLVGTVSDGGSNNLYMYRCVGATAITTANVLTVTLTQNANIEIVGSYVNSAYMVTDVTLTGSFPTSGGPTTVNIGPSSAVSFQSEILFSVIWFSNTALNNSPTFTVGSGWLNAGTANIGGFTGAGKWRGVQVQTRVESAAAGGYNITGTFNHDGSGIAFMAALRLGEEVGAITLGNRLIAGTAVETFTAAGAIILGDLVVSGGASQQPAAAGSVTLDNRLVAGTAAETFTAAGAIVLGDLVISGAGREQTATGAVVLGNRLAAGSALETFIAAGAIVLGDLLVSGTAIETFTAAAALVLGDRLVSGAALEQLAAGGVTLGDRLVAGAVLEIFFAAGALVLGDRLVAGTAVESFTAAGTLVLGDRLVAATALETFLAAGALVLGDRLAASAALEIFLAAGTLTLDDRQVAAAAIETFLAAGALVLDDRSVASALVQQLAAGALVLGDRLAFGTVSATILGNNGLVVLGDRLVNAAAIRRILVSAQLGLGIEQLSGLTQSAVAPINSMAAIQRLLPVGVETTRLLTPTLVLPVESHQRAVSARSTRIEAAQSLQQAASILTGAGAVISRQALFDLEATGFTCFQFSIDNAAFIALFGMTAQELLLQLLSGALVTITPEHLLTLRKSGSGTPLPIPQRG